MPYYYCQAGMSLVADYYVPGSDRYLSVTAQKHDGQLCGTGET